MRERIPDEDEDESPGKFPSCWGDRSTRDAGLDGDDFYDDDYEEGACGGVSWCLIIVCLICCVGIPGALALLYFRPWIPTPSKAFVKESKEKAALVATGQCDYEYPQGTADCFCQLAGNAACAYSTCACIHPQGCTLTDETGWDSSLGKTFFNHVDAGECEEKKALLTIPKSYFKDIEWLQEWCPQEGARFLLKDLMRSGFELYQAHVAPKPVKMCVHGGAYVSVQWLHIHTFCSDGQVEGMRETSASNWCSTLSSIDDIDNAVDELMEWSTRGKQPDPLKKFDSCESMGCGEKIPGPLCSCTEDCQHPKEGEEVDCCADFKDQCQPRWPSFLYGR